MKNTKWHAWHAARMARQIKKSHPFNFSLFFFFEINGDLCTFVAGYNFQNIINSVNIQLMTTKKMYEKPSMQVFEELEQQPQLLAGSYGQAGVQDYEHWYDVPEE